METPEIPQVDLPDEATQVDLPEFGETTVHPQTPDPQVSGDSGTAAGKTARIGFNV